jgi:hypothetical protein
VSTFLTGSHCKLRPNTEGIPTGAVAGAVPSPGLSDMMASPLFANALNTPGISEKMIWDALKSPALQRKMGELVKEHVDGGGVPVVGPGAGGGASGGPSTGNLYSALPALTPLMQSGDFAAKIAEAFKSPLPQNLLSPPGAGGGGGAAGGSAFPMPGPAATAMGAGMVNLLSGAGEGTETGAGAGVGGGRSAGVGGAGTARGKLVIETKAAVELPTARLVTAVGSTTVSHTLPMPFGYLQLPGAAAPPPAGMTYAPIPHPNSTDMPIKQEGLPPQSYDVSALRANAQAQIAGYHEQLGKQSRDNLTMVMGNGAGAGGHSGGHHPMGAGVAPAMMMGDGGGYPTAHPYGAHGTGYRESAYMQQPQQLQQQMQMQHQMQMQQQQQQQQSSTDQLSQSQPPQMHHQLQPPQMPPQLHHQHLQFQHLPQQPAHLQQVPHSLLMMRSLHHHDTASQQMHQMQQQRDQQLQHQQPTQQQQQQQQQQHFQPSPIQHHHDAAERGGAPKQVQVYEPGSLANQPKAARVKCVKVAEDEGMQICKVADGTYRCPTCGKSSKRKSDHIKHQRTHSKSKPYECTYPQCSARFSDPSTRSRHIKAHDPSARINCTYPGCGKEYSRQANMIRHLQTHPGYEEYVPVLVDADDGYGA